MSMISEQIDQLRRAADIFDAKNARWLGKILQEAADTIEMLSKKARPQDDDIRKLVDALKGDTSCDGCRYYKPEDEAFPFWQCDGCCRLYADYADHYEAAE